LNFKVNESLDKVSMGTVEKLTLENMGIALVDGCKGLFTSLSYFDFSRDVSMANN